MMRFFLSISLLVMNISWSMASANPEADSKQAAKAIMNGVYESFIKIIPYVYSDQSSIDALKKDPVKKAELIKNLTDISDFFKGVTT